jgi:biotin operon repressor
LTFLDAYISCSIIRVMKMETIWECNIETEALRLLHAAHQISVGFYKVNNFIVLPFKPSQKGLNFVSFPDLEYSKIPRFWERVRYLNIVDLPLKADEKLLQSTVNLLSQAAFPLPEYKNLKNSWSKGQDKILESLFKIIPNKKELLKKITIYPTAFGTSSSFNWINKEGEVYMYIRHDQDIVTIAEALITSLTRKDIYDKLGGMWQESEIITDWLLTQSSLNTALSKFTTGVFLPTIKGVRIKQHAKLLKSSDEFYAKLGFPSNVKIFGLNGLTPEINKKPLENLSPTEKKLLRLLILKGGNIASFDELGSEIFASEQNFSLYAISKNIERLRNKLEANGVSGSYIQTLRGKGYLLKN